MNAIFKKLNFISSLFLRAQCNKTCVTALASIALFSGAAQAVNIDVTHDVTPVSCASPYAAIPAINLVAAEKFCAIVTV